MGFEPHASQLSMDLDKGFPVHSQLHLMSFHVDLSTHGLHSVYKIQAFHVLYLIKPAEMDVIVLGMKKCHDGNLEAPVPIHGCINMWS